MSGFTKLFESITDSTIWRTPDTTRLVWITMLAMSDQNGYVAASVPGLADRARVSLEACLEALAAFQAPDQWSRTKDHEGRRIAEVDGGWLLLNHAKYRAIRAADERREYMRNLMAKRRAALADVSNVSPSKPKQKQKQKQKQNKDQKQKPAPSGVDFGSVSPQVVADFLAHRKAMRASVTQTALSGIAREAAKANMSLEVALAMCCARGWRGFKAEWVTNAPQAQPSRQLSGVAGFLGVNPNDLLPNQSPSLVSDVNRRGAGDLVPTKP